MTKPDAVMLLAGPAGALSFRLIVGRVFHDRLYGLFKSSVVRVLNNGGVWCVLGVCE